jgi:hypothetical protein
VKLRELSIAPESQISEVIRNEIVEFNKTEHTSHEVFLFLDKISKSCNCDISFFVQVLCDVNDFIRNLMAMLLYLKN